MELRDFGYSCGRAPNLLCLAVAVLVTMSGGTSAHASAAAAISSMDWDRRLSSALTIFGHRELRPWQQSVLMAWRDRQDVLVLSGTGVYACVRVCVLVQTV